MQCIYENQIITYIGEVAVHNMPGTPEAHRLYKSRKGFITIAINDADALVKPLDGLHEFNDVGCIHKIVTIIEVVERHFGPRQNWMVKSRLRHLVYPRHLTMWAARLSTSQTLYAIAKTMECDHATVLAAIKAVDKLIECGNVEITEAAQDIADEMAMVNDQRLNTRIKDVQSKSIFINKQKVEL
jgi:chromosomal replication initiation ATPase DnaA